MAHIDLGFPQVGLSRLAATYPFEAPIEFFDDFVTPTFAEFNSAANAASSTTKYYVGGTTGGAAPTISIATIPIVTSSEGGLLRFTTTANAGDTMVATPPGGFLRAAYNTQTPRTIVFQGRLTPIAISASSQTMGLTTVGGVTGVTTPFLVQAFGFYFVVVNGAVQVSYKTSAVTVAAAAVTYLSGPLTGTAVTATASTAMTFGIIYDGRGAVNFYVNGYLVKSASLATFTTLDLKPFWGLLGNAQSCDFDYVYAAAQPTFPGRS